MTAKHERGEQVQKGNGLFLSLILFINSPLFDSPNS